MKRRLISIIIIGVMLFGLIQPVYGKENIWSVINEAGQYEEKGELHKAFPLWLKIIEHFETMPPTYDTQTNIAIFSKKVGKYYDDEKQYDKAVIYYEKENANWLATDKPWGAEDMLRADAIRTEVSLHAEVKATDDNLAKHEPKAGVYLGIYTEMDDAIGQNFGMTKHVYGNHASHILYQNWNQEIKYGVMSYPLDKPLAQTIKSQDSAFHVAMNAMEGLESVEKNQWIIDWAKTANDLDMPIFLRFLSEMNGSWVPWHGDPELYIEKFRMVHDVMATYAPNVAMVWCPGDTPVETADGHRIEDYYPGDDYVDWVGVNFYTDYYNSGMTDGPNNHLTDPLSHLDYIYELYADKKPIMIGETGVAHYSVPNKEDVTDWGNENLKKLYSQINVKYPRVKAIHYFSVDQGDVKYKVGNRWSNYALSENDTFHETYERIIDAPYFLGKMSETYDKTYIPVEPYEASEYKQLAVFAKIPDVTISKIEFYMDDQLMATDRDYPFVVEGDFSETHYLTAKIYDSKNELSLVKKFNLIDLPVEPNPLGALQYHEPFVTGDLEGNFRPNAAITRAELIAMLTKVMPMKLSELKLPFEDSIDHWSMIDLVLARSAGLISGDANNNFRPDEAITRAEAAVIFKQYMLYTDNQHTSMYELDIKDLPDDHWATYALRSMLSQHLMFLDKGNSLPNNTLSRKEAVYIINRLTGRKIKGDAHPFNDVEGMWHRELDAATSRQLK